MRRRRWVILGILAFGLLSGGLVCAYYAFDDRTYEQFEFFPDTGLGPGADRLGRAVYEPRSEHVTLLLAHGWKEDPFITDSGGYEALAIEIPRPSSGERIELNDPNVRAAFGGGGMLQWKLGAKGITGQLQIQAVTAYYITLRYNIWADTYFDGSGGPVKRAMTFHGEATFREQLPRYGETILYLPSR